MMKQGREKKQTGINNIVSIKELLDFPNPNFYFQH